MVIFYRGAALNTHWHKNDARTSGGFTARAIGQNPDINRILFHIAHKRTNHSPFLSITRSFGVAYDYAVITRPPPTTLNPAFVYEINVPEPVPVVKHVRSDRHDQSAREPAEPRP